MAKEITAGTRMQVVRLYFEGLSYDEIAARTDTSKGSVAGIIAELKAGRFPHFEHATDLVETMRDLAMGSHKASMPPTEAISLFIVLRRLIGLGVEPTYLEAWMRMCQSLPEEDLPRSAVIQAATRLANLEQQGLSYEEAIARLEQASEEVKKLQANANLLSKEQAGLEELKVSLTRECQALAKERNRLEGERRRADEGLQNLLARSQRLGKQVEEREAILSRLEQRHQDLSAVLPKLEKDVAERTQRQAHPP
jgi:DNA repair exonuclease SbcCD ATPase subunit